jgi:hypothetical protein
MSCQAFFHVWCPIMKRWSSCYGVVRQCSSLASFLSKYSLHYSFPFLLKYDLIFGFNNCDSSIEKYEKLWMYFINPIHHGTLKVNHIFKLILLKSIITCTYYKFKLSFTSMIFFFHIFQVGLVTSIPMPNRCNNKGDNLCGTIDFFEKPAATNDLTILPRSRYDNFYFVLFREMTKKTLKP